MQEKLQANIWKLYILSFMRYFTLLMPVIVLFFQENGLNLTEILLLQSLFALVIVMLEIPSGYFADAFGRKLSIVLATLFLVAGWWIFTLATTFNQFLIVQVVIGIGASFLSGADAALLYDTLVELKQTSRFKKCMARIVFLYSMAEASAALVGGWLALTSLRTPVYAQAIVMTLMIPLALTMHEPQREKYYHQKGHLQSVYDITHYSLHRHKKVKWLIVFAAFSGMGTLTVAWLYQPYFLHIGLPLIYFGAAWMILNVLIAVSAHYAPAIENKIGKKRVLLLLPALFCASLTAFGFFPSFWILGLAIVLQAVRGIMKPLLLDYVNALVSSDKRATVLSIKHMGARFTYMLMAPLVGFISDTFTVPMAFLALSALLIITLGTAIVYLHKHKVV